MDKSEKIILEESLDEKELSETKNYKKIKYLIAIITSTLIFAAIMILSIDHFKFEVKEEETKPLVRNLGFDVTASKTFNFGCFNVTGQTISIKYVISMTKTQCQNKIVITSGLGSFEFGNKGMSSTGKGSRGYMTTIFKFKLPQFPKATVNGLVRGSLSWDVSLKSTNKYSIGLSGTLHFYSYMVISGSNPKISCEGKGILAEAKGNLIVSEGSIIKDSDFSLGMGNLKIIFNGSIFPDNIYTMTLFEGWRSI